MSEYGVVLFHTTSSVMKAEKFFKRAELKMKLIPTPREFSSDCGISIRFLWEYLVIIKQILDENKIEYDTIKKINTRGK